MPIYALKGHQVDTIRRISAKVVAFTACICACLAIKWALLQCRFFMGILVNSISLGTGIAEQFSFALASFEREAACIMFQPPIFLEKRLWLSLAYAAPPVYFVKLVTVSDRSVLI